MDFTSIAMILIYTDRLELSNIPGYQALIQLGRSRQDPILLDVGCCCECDTNIPWSLITEILAVGVDLRKVIMDGWPQDHAVATDIIPGQSVYDSMKSDSESEPKLSS